MTGLTSQQKRVYKLREFEAYMNETHICTSDCVYYIKCPLAYDSNKREPPCRVKDLVDEELIRYLTFFVYGQEGLKDEAFRILFKVGQILNLRDDAREMNIYLDMLLKIVRTFKIDVNSLGELDEPITIRLKDWGQKDLDTLDTAQKSFREEGLILQEDPESLVNSPQVIEKFMAKPNETKKRAIFVPKDDLIHVKT